MSIGAPAGALPATRRGAASCLAFGWVASLGALVAPALAETKLSLPLDCDLGLTCDIQQYVDADPGPGIRDFTGGPLSYDGHQGTDIRVADQEALADAPPVTAPADGTVLRVRDDVADGAFPQGQDCGNGLVLDHGDGLETQLCHLARGSITVGPGEAVARGQPVGRIGMTGRTEFPHVHLTVRRDGAVVDPFVEDLWQDAPDYAAGGLLSAGFASAVPDYDAIKAGTADAQVLAPSDPMVIWGHAFGTQAGDVLAMTIRLDDREVFAHEATFERGQAQAFRAAGRRAPDGGWPAGTYGGEVALIRDGTEIERTAVTVMVP